MDNLELRSNFSRLSTPHISDACVRLGLPVRVAPTREQLQFAEVLAKPNADPAYTFRRYLREIGGAIEE